MNLNIPGESFHYFLDILQLMHADQISFKISGIIPPKVLSLPWDQLATYAYLLTLVLPLHTVDTQLSPSCASILMPPMHRLTIGATRRTLRHLLAEVKGAKLTKKIAWKRPQSVSEPTFLSTVFR